MDWFEQVKALESGGMTATDAVYSREPMVRAAAARHPDLTDRQARSLARDAEPLVRTLVAMRPDLASETLDMLSYDTDVHVLRAVAARVDLTDGQWRRLARSRDAVVQSLLGRTEAAGWLRALPFMPDAPEEGRAPFA